jgi:hypothetical protein
MLANGLLEERDNGIYIVDPLLAMWIRNGRQGLVVA